MLQLLGGVFPCGLRLPQYRIGKCDSSACKLCGKMEMPSHILCQCPSLHDVITALDDKIWCRLFKQLKGALSSWDCFYDQLIGGMSLTELSAPLSGPLQKKKPDGVAQRPAQNECFLLEFTRTTDFWNTSLDTARICKEDKVGYYMLSALRERLPGWNVQLLTFVLEDSGLLDELLWGSNCRTRP
eukprot:1615248-Rhodomonas_salina.1